MLLEKKCFKLNFSRPCTFLPFRKLKLVGRGRLSSFFLGCRGSQSERQTKKKTKQAESKFRAERRVPTGRRVTEFLIRASLIANAAQMVSLEERSSCASHIYTMLSLLLLLFVAHDHCRYEKLPTNCCWM